MVAESDGSWWNWLRRTARVPYSELPQPLMPGQQVFDGGSPMRPWTRVRSTSFVALALVAILGVVAWRGASDAAKASGGPLSLRAAAAAAKHSPFLQEQEAEEVSVVWVGCFSKDDSHQLIGGPGKSGYNSQGCAQACKSYTYMVLQDGGKCLCGTGFAEDANAQQVFDGNCGDVCIGDDQLSPTRYCGTSDKNAVYRLRADMGSEATKASLVGSWAFGRERSECYVTLQEDGGLRFSVPLPQGQTAFGTLHPSEDSWMEADLSSNSGERVGTIRVQLTGEPGMLASNFKYPGETAWGKSTTAKKSDQATLEADRGDGSQDGASGYDSSDDGELVQYWEVVTKHGLNVRSMRDTSSVKLGTKWEGAIVRGVRHGVWLDLLDEHGYMLIADHGEALLQPMTGGDSSPSTTAPSTTTTRDNQPRDWIVVTTNGLFVRDDTDSGSLVLGTKVPGTMVRGVQTGAWIKLSDEPGYMMISTSGKTFLSEVSTTSTTSSKVEYCTEDCAQKPQGLECLQWTSSDGGCDSITDEETCRKSLDGRKELALSGRKVHGQPCSWCGGDLCAGSSIDGRTDRVCEAFDPRMPDADWENDKFRVASCADDHDKPEALTLFCYVLIMPSGYEPDLVKAQVTQAAGVFACDGFVVFSNASLALGPLNKTGAEVSTVIVPGSLAVPYGGKWYTALNTGIFLRVWRAVVEHGGYLQHDWVVKADADCVFFPSRLLDILMTHPMSSVPMLQRDSAGECGNCTLGGQELSCSAHIRGLQEKGATCESALRETSRPKPLDCGCKCGASSCYQNRDDRGAMFLVNCKFGLHGPIEVLSKDAIAVFESRIQECEVLRANPWGEDKYLDRCLQKLGVRRVLTYELLDETACGQLPVKCASSSVAFHPFKDIQAYFDCYGLATSVGTWPGDSLDLPAEETTGKLVINRD